MEKKKIYNETASLITNQALLNKLNNEELHFLLDLLDLVVVTNQQRPLIDVLHRWVNLSLSEENNSLIKDVILNTDVNDQAQVDASIQFIEELLCTSTQVTEAKEGSEDEQFLDL